MDSMKISVSGIEANNEVAAYPIARQLVEHFLNNLCAEQHFCTIIVRGHSYKNLDTGEGGTTIEADTLMIWRDRELPREFSLSKDWQAAAYWRRAQTSADVFDKFRNLYLIVDRVGKNVKQSRDSDVLRNTIRTVAVKDLSKLSGELSKITIPSGISLIGKIEEDLKTLLYKAYRCTLMHAGDTTKDREPFNLEHEREVASALKLMEMVAKLYLDYEKANHTTC